MNRTELHDENEYLHQAYLGLAKLSPMGVDKVMAQMVDRFHELLDHRIDHGVYDESNDDDTVIDFPHSYDQQKDSATFNETQIRSNAQSDVRRKKAS